MNDTHQIIVERISRSFGRYRAVSDISFRLRRGEVLGFLGPNGAGKTTTMQILCGILAANSGTVTIGGHDIVEQPLQAKGLLGFLPEQPPLYLEQTVDEYLMYCGQLRGIAGNRLPEALEIAKQRCGLQQQGGRLLGNLSKGYQQRVGIAQAIIHNPEFIILDEPTVGLDPNQIAAVRQLIRELGREHGVILSTHILSEVRAVCDRVLIINSGKLLLDQPIQTLEGDALQGSLLVAFRSPPGMAALTGLAGVSTVEQIDQQRFRIGYPGDYDMATQLTGIAVQEGWGIFELIPEAESLERIFMRLTAGEQEQRLPA